MTANDNRCVELVYSDCEKNPVEYEWKRGEEKLPIVDEHACLGVEIQKNFSGMGT